jgi:hypothetical protein
MVSVIYKYFSKQEISKISEESRSSLISLLSRLHVNAEFSVDFFDTYLTNRGICSVKSDVTQSMNPPMITESDKPYTDVSLLRLVEPEPAINLGNPDAMYPFSYTLLNSNSPNMGHFGNFHFQVSRQSDSFWLSCY